MTAHENTHVPDVSSGAIELAGTGVLNAAGAALSALAQGWDRAQVQDWCTVILSRKGRVVLTGMGKSGLVAQKISATLASTGTPSFFLHPAEALHGDLGMVTPEDAVIALSNSGESEEIVRLLPSLLRLEVPIAGITNRPESSLGKASKWCFTYALPSGEGCPLELAPMASTTLQLMWGDLLAACLMEVRGFTKEGFALNHPAGALGAKLLKTRDLMRHEWPSIPADASLVQVLHAMTGGRLGMTMVGRDGAMAGVITDGDIRRGLEKAQERRTNPLDLRAADLMSPRPITVPEDMLALEAANLMEGWKITFLMVGTPDRVSGVLHIHDLLTAKVL